MKFIAPVLIVWIAMAGSSSAQEWTTPLGSELQKYHQPEVNAIHFFNRHVGWVVGGHAQDASARNSETFIFQTGDGGETWERHTLYDGQEHVPDFVDVGFADANNGWLLSDKALVLRTTDGGRIWEPVEPLPRGWGRTLLVLGPDAVMVGSSSTNGRQINVTTDGGRSWTNSTVSAHGRHDAVDLAFVQSGSFFSVIASAMQDYGGVYRSDDGGGSWNAVVEGKEPLHTIAFSKSGRSGVAAGVGVAYSTTDGGSTWQRVPVAGTRLTAGFLDENTVVAFGSDPAMLISGDGGRTWQSGRETGLTKTSQLVDVQFVDPGWWLIAGGRGAYDFYRYVDPDYVDPIARGTLPLPKPVEAPDGTVLPPGTYETQLVHHGLDHVLGLHLKDPAADVEIGVSTAPGDEPGPNQFACDPCDAEIPVNAEYDTQELKEGREAGSIFKLALEPTTTGFAIVLDAPATTSRDPSIALAALGVRSAVSAPLEIYQVRVRYPLEIFGGADEER